MSETPSTTIDPEDGALAAGSRDTELPVAKLESAPPVVANEEIDERETCSNCGVVKSSHDGDWCPHCGYYALLGTFIEPDATEEEIEAAAADELPLWKKIPTWAYSLAAAMAGMTVFSFLSWVLTAEASTARMTWGLTQLGVGVLCFCIAHMLAYVQAIMEDSTLGLMDIVLKPIHVWTPTVLDLPKSQKRVMMASCGSYAALLAVAVVGGLPYESLWNWGPEKRAEMNLVHAITENAAVEPMEGDLEESVEAFAGQAGNPDGLPAIPETEEDQPSAKRTLDCVILGYTVNEDDESQIDALILGALVRKKFRLVGSVSYAKDVPEEAKLRLKERLPEIRRPTPFIRSLIAAKWVEPVITCHVRFRDWSSTGKIQGGKVTELLAEVSAP